MRTRRFLVLRIRLRTLRDTMIASQISERIRNDIASKCDTSAIRPISANNRDVPAKRIIQLFNARDFNVSNGSHLISLQSVLRSRSAFAITETELKLIAAPAIIGLSSRPKNG